MYKSIVVTCCCVCCVRLLACMMKRNVIMPSQSVLSVGGGISNQSDRRRWMCADVDNGIH